MTDRWHTVEELGSARQRLIDAMPGWRAPSAYGLGRLRGAELHFERVETGEHVLPGVVLAFVTGYTHGVRAYRLSESTLDRAIEMLAPAQACLAYDHPNLAAWRRLRAGLQPGDIVVAAFADHLDPQLAERSADDSEPRADDSLVDDPLSGPGDQLPGNVADRTVCALVEQARQLRAGPLARHDYVGTERLEQAERLVTRTWMPDSRFHLGDLAWQYAKHPDGIAGVRTAVWSQNGKVVAWAACDDADGVDLVVDTAFGHVVESIVEWAGDRPVTVLDTEQHLVGALTALGFVADPAGPHFRQHRRDLADLPPVPTLPAGWQLRAVTEEDDPHRLDLHRTVWAPSTLTAANYAALTGAWPYDRRFDLVAESPDGRLAAYCLGWYDELNRVGLFEPVGTVDEFRRRGLSRAVGIAAMHAFREAGGRLAIVYPRGDNEYPVPRQVYQALGFRPFGRTITYRR